MQLNEFKERILPLKDQLFRLAFCLLRSREDAEDTVQEVLLKLWNGQHKLDEIRNPAAYCVTITKNMAFDRLRRAGHQSRQQPLEPHDAVDHQTPFIRLQQAERQQLFHRLMNALPADKQLLIQLRDIEGKSYLDIAETLDISESKVKTDLFRTRQQLKQALDKMNAHGQI